MGNWCRQTTCSVRSSQPLTEPLPWAMLGCSAPTSIRGVTRNSHVKYAPNFAVHLLLSILFITSLALWLSCKGPCEKHFKNSVRSLPLFKYSLSELLQLRVYLRKPTSPLTLVLPPSYLSYIHTRVYSFPSHQHFCCSTSHWLTGDQYTGILG